MAYQKNCAIFGHPVRCGFNFIYVLFFVALWRKTVTMCEWRINNKRLSYGRDSAIRRSLRRSLSFRVTDFGINRKPACDFLLVNNTNLHPISQLFSSYSSVTVKVSPLLRGFLLFMHSFSVISENIAKCRSYIAKSYYLDYIFIADSMGLLSTTFT